MMMMMLRRRNTRAKLSCCLLPLKNLVAPYHSSEAETDPNDWNENARKVYDKMLQSRPLPPLERFNRLLGRFLKYDLHPAVISLNREMALHGIARDEYTLSTLVSSYCHLKQLEFGLSVMGNVIKMGLQADAIALDSLIHGFVLEKKVPEAAEIFKKLLREGHCKPSDVAFGTLLQGFGDIGNPKLYDFQLFSAIFADMQATVVTKHKYVAQRPDDIDSLAYLISLQATRGTKHKYIAHRPDNKDSFADQAQCNMLEFFPASGNRDISYANQESVKRVREKERKMGGTTKATNERICSPTNLTD